MNRSAVSKYVWISIRDSVKTPVWSYVWYFVENSVCISLKNSVVYSVADYFQTNSDKIKQ